MNNAEIRISNSGRSRKIESSKNGWGRDKPLANRKCLTFYQKEKMMGKMGYRYQTNYSESNVMKELKEGFSGKCDQYFVGPRANKMGRKDKHKLKERIGFEPKIHPILKMFNTLNSKLVKPSLQQGLQGIIEHAEPQLFIN